MDKQDKSKADYEFERSGEECTFAPKLMSKTPKYIKDRKQSSTIASGLAPAQSPPGGKLSLQERQRLNEQK